MIFFSILYYKVRKQWNAVLKLLGKKIPPKSQNINYITYKVILLFKFNENSIQIDKHEAFLFWQFIQN